MKTCSLPRTAVGATLLTLAASLASVSVLSAADQPGVSPSQISNLKSQIPPASGGYTDTYYINDHLATTIATIDARGIIDQIETTAFGAPLPEGRPAVRYTGKPWDEDLGAYVFPFRNYRPDEARWMTPDPSGFPDGANNRHYAPLPTRGVDRLGLSWADSANNENAGYGDQTIFATASDDDSNALFYFNHEAMVFNAVNSNPDYQVGSDATLYFPNAPGWFIQEVYFYTPTIDVAHWLECMIIGTYTGTFYGADEVVYTNTGIVDFNGINLTQANISAELDETVECYSQFWPGDIATNVYGLPYVSDVVGSTYTPDFYGDSTWNGLYSVPGALEFMFSMDLTQVPPPGVWSQRDTGYDAYRYTEVVVE